MLSPKRALSFVLVVLPTLYLSFIDGQSPSTCIIVSIYAYIHILVLVSQFHLFFFPLAGNILKFIRVPPTPIYALRGNDVIFKWVYAEKHKTVELNSIIWSVKNQNDKKEYALIVELSNGTVIVNPHIPKAYLNRVEKRDQATLVVKKVTFEDSTTFSCLLRSTRGSSFDTTSRIQLLVTGPAVVGIE